MKHRNIQFSLFINKLVRDGREPAIFWKNWKGVLGIASYQ